MDPQFQLASWDRLRQKDPELLIKEIQNDILSSSFTADPPFGKKKAIYTDFFASSRPLGKFESIIRESVLPFYANTHTTTTSTSRTTTTSVKLARETIRRCTNAISTPDHELQSEIIFSGDGSTSAINKVRNVFRLGDEAYWIRKALAESRASQSCRDSAHTSTSCTAVCCLTNSDSIPSPSSSPFPRLDPQNRPVVFLSIQEHHSNLLPWRESCADVIVIPEIKSHQLDLKALEDQLIRHQNRPLKLGTFSAGSNLTGVLNDTIKIAKLLHKYDAFAFFDYAGVGPYTAIDMNPVDPESASENGKNLAYKDGVFISTHKFLGGPGASGILIARREIFGWAEKHSGTDRNEYIPATPGGGTVDMVIQGRHKYTNNILAREEAGTPNILATIRTGLVFQLQDIIGPEWVLKKEYALAKKVLKRLTAPSMEKLVQVLGASDLDRVAVFSLTIAVPKLLSQDRKRPLQIHYALLSTLMNDFFGIEMRGGCMCAGPYASQLLKFDTEMEAEFWRLLSGEDEDNSKGKSSIDKEVCGEARAGDCGKCSEYSSSNIHQRNLSSKSLKPGFVRFSFSYFTKDKDVEFVVQSLEWMAKYGYLLIPLYKLDAKTGEWSVREAVRKAVLAEIPSRRILDSRRGNCIPMAIDCINGLQRLFQEQANLTKRQTSSQATQSSELSHEGPTDDIQSNREFIPLVRQAKDSWVKLSGAFTQFATPQVPPERQAYSDASTTVYSGSVQAEADEGDYIHTTFIRDSSNNNGSLSGSATESTSSLGTINDTAGPTKRFNLLPTIHKNAKNHRIQADALEELSMDLLHAENDAVEINDLAKKLKWFASPLDVALVYVKEFTKPSNPSPFP
ncbi:hypothetical protein BGX27_011385 [Mortierella sp. AM989]|nr:hypothetical protein BGX27_011385 [Mortierella sp. AM989]